MTCSCDIVVCLAKQAALDHQQRDDGEPWPGRSRVSVISY